MPELENGGFLIDDEFPEFETLKEYLQWLSGDHAIQFKPIEDDEE